MISRFLLLFYHLDTPCELDQQFRSIDMTYTSTAPTQQPANKQLINQEPENNLRRNRRAVVRLGFDE